FQHSGTGGAAAGKKNRTWKNLKQILSSERTLPWQLNDPSYFSIDAPPSFKPVKKYSDISGLPVSNIHLSTGRFSQRCTPRNLPSRALVNFTARALAERGSAKPLMNGPPGATLLIWSGCLVLTGRYRQRKEL
ncbi:INO80 complex subunit C, partial [Python bivittatus]|uniref:INO80 complex subunit C n=1 Tax=Python bivittatus TaxID=176946 RepID=A0A9F5J3T5_PYTBI